MTKGNREKINEPNHPEIVLFGLILVSFFPPIVLPTTYPPMSENTHTNIINRTEILLKFSKREYAEKEKKRR